MQEVRAHSSPITRINLSSRPHCSSFASHMPSPYFSQLSNSGKQNSSKHGGRLEISTSAARGCCAPCQCLWPIA
eukprot:524010-Prorocentrum_minimum.AAC.1